MKKFRDWSIISLIIWIIFTLSTALAQQSTGPQMVLEKNDFDAQIVREGEIIKHAFSVFNKGDSALEIEKVQPG